MAWSIVHNTALQRFQIEVGEQVAVLNYHLRGRTMIFAHTGVPPALEGRGIGSALVRAGLTYARDHGYAIDARCSFVVAYLRRHPEFAS